MKFGFAEKKDIKFTNWFFFTFAHSPWHKTCKTCFRKIFYFGNFSINVINNVQNEFLYQNVQISPNFLKVGAIGTLESCWDLSNDTTPVNIPCMKKSDENYDFYKVYIFLRKVISLLCRFYESRCHPYKSNLVFNIFLSFIMTS